MPSRRIALVDLNVRHPRLGRLLGCGRGPGLGEVVAGSAGLAQIAQPAGSANMLFYAAGGAASTTLLRSEGLVRAIGQIIESHDYVLCDSAPANLFPDAGVLAPLFDGVVLVAEAGATRRESLAQAKKRVELGGGRVLGVILNKRRYPVPRFLYRRS
jgi:Mrp family chromosome partitioning ATPase